MAETKQPNEMTATEALEAIYKRGLDHDHDCEEGVGSDRCIPCLAAAALKAVKTGRAEPKDTPQVDHREKALKLLEESYSAPAESLEQAGRDAVATALVHSNLAIAEGQQRVAEAVGSLSADLRDLGKDLGAIRARYERHRWRS